MFNELVEATRRPAVFEHYTAADLWTDEYVSAQMLRFHLNGEVDLASRKTEFLDRSADWLISHFALAPDKRVADFGCGPGLYTTRLAKSGAEVVGVDFSQRSIRYARQTAEEHDLDVRYYVEDYLRFDVEKDFDLITLIMCDYCALSPEQRGVLLGRIRSALVDGGALVFDVYSPAAFDAKEEATIFGPNLMNRFWSEAEYFGFLCSFKYEAEAVTLDKYTIVAEERTRVVYNWLQHFTPESLTRELESHGFTVEKILADVAGGRYEARATEFAVIARPA